jgi:hypothetical protein
LNFIKIKSDNTQCNETYERSKGLYENKTHFCSVYCLKSLCKTNNIDIPINYDSEHEEKESYEVFKTTKKINKEGKNNDNIKYNFDYDPMEDF